MQEKNISKVYLLSVPLESDYKHTLYFKTKGDQESYFKSLIKSDRTFTDFTYQRKDNIIKVPKHYDDIYNCNYVMYQNTKYSNKWFYAFIKNMQYISDGVTQIEIETDVIQTWMFDYVIQPSFVEREHVLEINDKPGMNTVPENLDTGEYIIDKEETINVYGDCEPVLAVTQLPGGNNGDKQVFNQYNGLFQGCAFLIGAEDSTLGMFGGVANIIQNYVDNGKMDAIQSIFMCPKSLTDSAKIYTQIEAWGGEVVTYGLIPQSADSWGACQIIGDKPTKLGVYKPRNKKLLSFPYCYLNLDNNAGSCVQYRYEHFNMSHIEFGYSLTLVPGISTKIYPVNYQGITENYHYATTGAKLPICSWSSDVYTNWLTQNSVNIGVSLASGMASITAGVLTGGLTGLISAGVMGSGVFGILNTMATDYQHSLMPPSLEGNLNGGDVNFSLGLHNPKLYFMSIKAEFAEKIDKFFDAFGYKVNKFKVPNTDHKKNYWYTKTIDVNIDGAIPNKDLDKIKDCYNNGITFWRNPEYIGQYSDEYWFNLYGGEE